MATDETSQESRQDDPTRQQDVAALVVGLGAFVLGLWMVLDIAAMASNPIASLSGGIDAKQYPTWLGAALMILSVAVVAAPGSRLFRGYQKSGHVVPWGRVVCVVLGLFFYIFAFRQLGYIVSTTLFGAILMLAAGARKGVAVVGFPAGLTVAVYWLVRLAFSIHLPFGSVWSGLLGGGM